MFQFNKLYTSQSGRSSIQGADTCDAALRRAVKTSSCSEVHSDITIASQQAGFGQWYGLCLPRIRNAIRVAGGLLAGVDVRSWPTVYPNGLRGHDEYRSPEFFEVISREKLFGESDIPRPTLAR